MCKKADETKKQPDCEAKWPRIVAKKSSAQEPLELSEGTLCINPGERIHRAVILEFDDGNTAKVLSKIRDQDGRINVLVKNKRPTGGETVSESDTWITEKDYEKFIAVLKKDKDIHEVLNISSEQIHKDVIWTGDLAQTKRSAG